MSILYYKLNLYKGMKKVAIISLLFVVSSALAIPANLNNNNKLNDDWEDKIELGRQGGTTRVAKQSTFNMQSVAAEPKVEVYSSDNVLQISVQNYRGPVWVEIYGDNGAKQSTFEVYDMGFEVIGLSGLGASEYNVRITVGSSVFNGKINKEVYGAKR